MTADPTPTPEQPRVEPVDTLHEAIDKVMPVLSDFDSDQQSRWSTAALLLAELEERGYRLVEAQVRPEQDTPPPVPAAPGLDVEPPADWPEWAKRAVRDANKQARLHPADPEEASDE